MKKHLLLSICSMLFLNFISSSQVFLKKDKLFGATAGITFTSANNIPNPPFSNQHSNNIAFMPSFGWAIKNNLAMGIKGNFTYFKMVLKGATQKYVTTSLETGPEIFLRKYKALKDRFGVFFNHGIDFNYTKNTNKTNQVKNTTILWGGGYNFTPGAFYKFSNRFLGEASFGGLALRYVKNNDGTKSFNAGINFLSYFNVGVQYIIPGKKS